MIGTLERSGVRLWYSATGSGRPVVLHTGGGGDSDMFERAGYVDALLRAGYRVVCYDHRGHGRSGKPLRREDHRTDEYVDDLVALLDALKVPSGAIIGYSQGMDVAIAFAATQPDRVAAVVGIGSVGAADDPTEWRAAAAASVRQNGMAASMNAMAASESEPPPKWLLDNLSATDSEIYALLLEAGLDEERTLWDHMGEVRAPTLLVVGESEEDEEGIEPGLAARNARRAAELLLNGREFVVPGLAHLEIFWRTDLTLPAIKQFLAEHYATNP
jgi:3-oxoadipate enol-lactonase